VELAGCKLVMEISTHETTLIIPDEDETYPVWHGTPKSLQQWSEEFQITRSIYMKDLKGFLEILNKEGRVQRLFTLNIETFPFKEWVKNEYPGLFRKALWSARAVKNELEIEIIKDTCRISSLAHIEVMRQCDIGLTELHLESLFLHYTSWRGCRQQAYVPVIGTGLNGAVLHYNENNSTIKNGDLVVIDAGCEYMGYASDITRTFPANGKFTEEQKIIYQIVLNTQKKFTIQCQTRTGL